MVYQSDYVTVSVTEDVRQQARIVKAKRGQSWSAFLSDAAAALDPESSD